MSDKKTKICSKKDCRFAGQEQDVNNFNFRDKKKGTYRAECKLCIVSCKSKYYQKNKKEISIKGKQYRKDHPDKIKITKIKYRKNNKDKIAIKKAQYFQDNKDKINKTKRKNYKKRAKNDLEYKFRENFSCLFRSFFKSHNINKDRNSTFKILGYTPAEIRKHIYSQFNLPENLDKNGKVWMTPDNQGVYNKKTWDENDSSTWKWQIDHKTPQSEFHPTSKDDPAIKECWALTNLRPYRADLNIKDGASGIRHATPRKNSKLK